MDRMHLIQRFGWTDLPPDEHKDVSQNRQTMDPTHPHFVTEAQSLPQIQGSTRIEPISSYSCFVALTLLTAVYNAAIPPTGSCHEDSTAY